MVLIGGDIFDWLYDPDLRAYARPATAAEIRTHGWRSETVLLAFSHAPPWLERPFSEFRLPLPAIVSAPRSADGNQIVFGFVDVRLIETVQPGSFSTTTTRGTDTSRPDFFHYLDLQETASVLTGSLGQVVATAALDDGSLARVRGPLRTSVALDQPSPSPDGAVFVVEPAAEGTEPRSFCENGFCQPSGDPDFDECLDGWDQDPDGKGDNCDWNCLPHLDFGDPGHPITDPKASDARVEWGKSVALMGTGSFCTARPDTWETEVAAKALEELSFLQSVRNSDEPDFVPDLPPVRPRLHHCWVFPDEDSVRLCTLGPSLGGGAFGPPVCPGGLEDYPYQREEFEDDGLIASETTYGAAWSDVQRVRDIEGGLVEPVHMVQVLEDEVFAAVVQRCEGGAGIAGRIDQPVPLRGASINCAFDQTRNMAHEFGHSLGLEHDQTTDPNGDCVGAGFMNANAGPCPWVANTTFDNLPYPNFAQYSVFLASKALGPRSAGYAFSGCSGDVDCRPWGGTATCEGTICIPE